MGRAVLGVMAGLGVLAVAAGTWVLLQPGRPRPPTTQDPGVAEPHDLLPATFVEESVPAPSARTEELGARVRGRVVDQAARPLAGVTVELHADAQDEDARGVAVSAQDGTFRLEPSEGFVGPALLRARRRGDGAPAVLGVDRPLVVPDSGAVDVGDLVALFHGSVRTTLVDARGVPIEGTFHAVFDLRACAAAPQLRWQQTERIEDGTRVEFVPPGEVRIRVTHHISGFIAETAVRVEPDAETQATLVLPDSARARPVVLTVLLQGVALASGAPHPDHVTLTDALGTVHHPASHEGCLFTFEPIAGLAADARVDDPAFEPLLVEHLDVSSGLASISVRGRGRIVLSVRSTDGTQPDFETWLWEPSTRDSVTFFERHGADESSALARALLRGNRRVCLELVDSTLASDGSRIYPGIAGGPYSLLVLASGRPPASVAIERLAPGATAYAALTLDAAAALRIEVLEAGSKSPLAGALVNVCRPAQSNDGPDSVLVPLMSSVSGDQSRLRKVIMQGTTGADGSCTFVDLKRGPVLVRASVNGLQWVWSPVQGLDGSTASTVTILIGRPGGLLLRFEGPRHELVLGARARLRSASEAGPAARFFAAKKDVVIGGDGLVRFDGLDPGSYDARLVLGGGRIPLGAAEHNVKQVEIPIGACAVAADAVTERVVPIRGFDLGVLDVEAVAKDARFGLPERIVVERADGTGQAVVLEEGRGRIGPLPAGAYSAWLVADGGERTVRVPAGITVRGGEILPLRLPWVVARGTVTVRGPDGAALGGVPLRVRYETAGGVGQMPVVADAAGTLDLTLCPGEFVLLWNDASHALQAPFTWTENGPLEGTLVFRDPASAGK